MLCGVPRRPADHLSLFGAKAVLAAIDRMAILKLR
jgi:hypothetical protein